MRLVYAIVAIVIATVAVGIAWYALRENPTDGVFGSRANAAIVAQPSRVEAYRLGSLSAQIYSQDAAPSDYPVIAGPTVLPTEISAELSNALLSKRRLNFIRKRKADRLIVTRAARANPAQLHISLEHRPPCVSLG